MLPQRQSTPPSAPFNQGPPAHANLALADSVPRHTSLPRWHILQTRARQEKAIRELLADSPAQPFLPTFKRVMHYGHRRRTVELPLFSGYIFVFGLLEHAFAAIGSRRIVRTLPVTDQATLAHELEQLRRAMEGGAGSAQFSPYRYLTRGMRVRVTSGPFKDIEGLVDGDVLPGRGGSGRLILQIQTLGRATSLEIDPSLLARLDD